MEAQVVEGSFHFALVSHPKIYVHLMQLSKVASKDARRPKGRRCGYSVLAWPDGLPYLELNCSLGLNGAVFLLLPIFFTVTILKAISLDVLQARGACILREYVWHTDLDFLIIHKNRSLVLSFAPVTGNLSQNSVMALNMLPQKFFDPGAIFSSANVTHTVMKTLKDIIGHETRKYEPRDADGVWDSSISLEYINLIIALVIYSVRYPAIFWSANKCLGLLFSFLLFINGQHIVLSFAGISVLYKIHVADIWTYMSFSQQNSLKLYKNFDKVTPFLLNAQVTFGLYMLSTLLVLASSVVMYFYGHTRFTAFINHQRDKKLITLQGSSSNAWLYFTHCAAFCLLISIGICNVPLIHDYTVAYRGSFDDIPLICIIYNVFHFFFWVITWIFLSMKQNWTFKIRISIGEAVIKESRSLRLIHSVQLNQQTETPTAQQPFLVIGNGRTYTVSDTLPKKAIMDVLQRSAIVKKSKSNGSMAVSEDSTEDIYWLRPTLDATSQSQKRSKYLNWFRKKSKQKLAFDQIPSTSNNRAKSHVRNSAIPGLDEDDGDYATLRELPLAATSATRFCAGDNISEEGKLLACVQDEEITYASTSQDFTPPVMYKDSNPLLEPIVVHTEFPQQPSTSVNSARLIRADSGILAHEELPGRSDSLSTECSVSPPDPPGSSHSESSSGVHSNESNDTSVVKQVAEAILKEDPYGRATNMRMTSFMDSKGMHSQSSSATLPHYPTQPSVQNMYSNCSTMPLPQHTSGNIGQPITNGNRYC
ncbi:hypothetical protein D910_06626 [Dendroctonus ponderosae]|uniref:Protein tincar n=1 Tax=Dendroctonus ponderosae TaxID=77166 RepID=U4UA69_DENPD|nr:hypothetical protein D910_06626 [Dendroctonus ponderosae]